MRHVWRHSNQKGSALLLLLAIASYADENGMASASLKTLAARIRMSRRQTMRLVARLEDAGELLVLRREGRGNLYRVPTSARWGGSTGAWQALAKEFRRAASPGAPLSAGTVERIVEDLVLSQLIPW